ncbi:MAG: hypothetical protein PW792_07230 [Acidobacteriaceae bacterium]|nr:hypothetical protein [Acidobacteriaceae bacterium]
MLTPLLQSSIDALSRLDAEKLEELCSEAETLVAEHREESLQGAVEARALKRTLFELLRTTDENLRLLRELRGMRVQGVASDDAPNGGPQWVR